MTARRVRSGILPFRTSDESHRVTTFELFFDLVFVFAFTQVTVHMARTLSAVGVFEGMIILGILWWSWVSYSWLANQTSVGEGLARIGMSVAVAAMFLLALTITEAFEDQAGGLNAPLVLAVSYVVVRVTHLLLYIGAAVEDRPLRSQVLRTSAATFVGSAIIVVGAVVGGPAQMWLWLSGLAVDVALTYITSRRGDWRVHSAAHWAERYGLVVILALGESQVAIGLGVVEKPISINVIAGALLAIAVSMMLWWLYFDVTSMAAERELARRKGGARASLAIDGYTYLHFPIIAGIIILALGVEQAMQNVDRTAPLGLFAACALFGGASLYLAGHAAFWWRTAGSIERWRLGAATLLLALIPVGAALHPLAALGLVAGIVGAVVTVETVRYGHHRAEVRARSTAE
jgi:low temperature requirement protein LtrA